MSEPDHDSAHSFSASYQCGDGQVDNLARCYQQQSRELAAIYRLAADRLDEIRALHASAPLPRSIVEAERDILRTMLRERNERIDRLVQSHSEWRAAALAAEQGDYSEVRYLLLVERTEPAASGGGEG